MQRLRAFGLMVAAALAFPAAVYAISTASIPAKFGLVWGQNAGAPYIRSIPQSSQIGIQNCAASLNDGFPPLTFTPGTAGGCPPFGQDFNGILKQLSQWAQWQSAGGPVFYDGTFSATAGGYPFGAVLASTISISYRWISTTDNNTTNPDAGGAGWSQDPGQVLVGTPMQSLTTTIPFGYVSMNGTTIGDVSSNATGRAAPDTLFLFVFNWNTCGNAQCPIFTSGGSASTRGATCTLAACADYAAHKALAVPNFNGTALMGADSQNGTSSSLLVSVPVTSGSRTTPLSILGENLHTLTLTELATGISSANASQAIAVDASASGFPKLAGTNGTLVVSNTPNTGSPFINPAVNSGSGTWGAVTSLTGNNAISVTSNNTGGGAHNNVERSAIVYWIQKL